MVRILHDDWSIRLGGDRPNQSSQTSDGYTVQMHTVTSCILVNDLFFEMFSVLQAEIAFFVGFDFVHTEDSLREEQDRG